MIYVVSLVLHWLAKMLSFNSRGRSGIREEINENTSDGLFTSMKCRTIRVGSYKYTPKEKVYISPKGIKIVAPSLKDKNDVALQIQTKEIVKILIHYSKALPVLFLYTTSSCGAYIRKALEMTDHISCGYYDPISRDDQYKRITLLPETISDEVKNTLKARFIRIIDELTSREANEILVKTCPKEVINEQKILTRSMCAQNSQGAKNSNTEIRQILIYPPGSRGISINTEDYMCLAQDQFLNDVIIDFYLKYLINEVLTESQQKKTYIFSTFFYKRLTTKPSKMTRAANPLEWDSSLTAAQKRHMRVKKWTKDVNIFEKDFIVVPINENCHWFVAIVCFPSLDGCRSMIDNRVVTPQEIRKKDRKSSMQIGNTTITPVNKQEQLTLNCDGDNLSERDEAEAEESDLDMQCDSDEEEGEKAAAEAKPDPIPTPIGKFEPIKQPCVLIFDSLAGASRSRVVATIRDYLTCEYHAKVSTEKKFTKDNMKGICPKIPQQNNFTDCGLYLLQYVEQFFNDPIVDYTIPIKQLANWFDEIVVTRKREEISNLLKRLMVKYNGDSPQCLPEIAFPTLNGKLIENEEQQDGESSTEGGTITAKETANDAPPPQNATGVATLVAVKQLQPSGEYKRKISLDLGEHVRKTIRLSTDGENRSLVQLKTDNDSQQIFIPVNMHGNDFSALLNKQKLGEKRSLNQSVSNCIRASENTGDIDTMLYKKKVANKIEDSNELSKKFKKSEC